jgi:hypothetical protein
MLSFINVFCHLCWVSHISDLCWVSLCLMSLCWVSWRQFLFFKRWSKSWIYVKKFSFKCRIVSLKLLSPKVFECQTQNFAFPKFCTFEYWNMITQFSKSHASLYLLRFSCCTIYSFLSNKKTYLKRNVCIEIGSLLSFVYIFGWVARQYC